VLVDWRYLHDRSLECITHEAGWIGRQKLRVIVDLTSGINLYPDLRLLNNRADDYAASRAAIDDVLAKMKALGSRDLVISLHPRPETNMTSQQHADLMTTTFREICRQAEALQIVVYLRAYPNRPPGALTEGLKFLKRVGMANLKLAPSTSLLSAADVSAEAAKAIGLWMAGELAVDVTGTRYSVHKPLAGNANRERLMRLLATASGAPVVFDAIYENHDAEYFDASFLASP